MVDFLQIGGKSKDLIYKTFSFLSIRRFSSRNVLLAFAGVLEVQVEIIY